MTTTSTAPSLHWKPDPTATRVLCFDLENRPLAYWYDGETTSEITAFGWKWSDWPEGLVETLLLRPDGYFEDSSGVQAPPDKVYKFFASQLQKADLVYGHNIRRHDLPMLQAGLLRRQLPPLKPLPTSDTLKDHPRVAGMSRSLENLAAYYGLEGEKYVMSQPMWEDANRLTNTGIKLARKRVVSDVILQERLRAKLQELGILGPPKKWKP